MRYVSITHTIAYSIIAIQELNLAYFYPRVFWNTACLIVDSGGLEDQTDVFDDDDDEDEGEAAKSKPKKALDYGKISTAINKMKQFGVLVAPPDVNKSSFTFKPEVETNTIFYGLKGILEAAQTVSAPPVVYCKECKHSYITVGARCCSYGAFYDVAVQDDFFCANGTRKEENSDETDR